MKETRFHHFIVKVGNMYVGDFGRLGVSLVSVERKRKAQQFEDNLVIDVVKQLESMGLKATIIRVDEAVTVTETEVSTIDIVSE